VHLPVSLYSIFIKRQLETMKYLFKFFTTSAALLYLIPLAYAQADVQQEGSAVLLEGTTRYKIQSPNLDLPLKVYVLEPSAYDRAQSYPVLYAFDADLTLGLMSTMSQQVSRMAIRADRRPPIVVTVGYGDTKRALQRRIFDLTPHAENYNLPLRPNGLPWPKLGGGDNFLNILIEEIKPFIESRYNIDKSSETLYGHSLGGLLTLHALITRHSHFDKFVASSPSLWFNPEKTMQGLIAFHNDTGSTTPTQKIPLRLSVGGNEEKLTQWSHRYSKNADMRKEWLSKNKMVRNAKVLYQALNQTNGKVAVKFEVYEGLEHTLAHAPAFLRALQFATADGVR